MEVSGLEIDGGWVVERDTAGLRLLRGTEDGVRHHALTHAADLPVPEVRARLLRHVELLEAMHGRDAVTYADRPTRVAVRLVCGGSGESLSAAMAGRPIEDVTAAFAVLCDSVARVHCAGWALGGLRAEDVVVETNGPRLRLLPDAVEGGDPLADQQAIAELLWAVVSSREHVPASLRAVLDKAMDPDVSHRYPSVLGLGADFRAGRAAGWPDVAEPEWLGHHRGLLTWRPSGRLFGREEALAALDAAVDDVHIAGAPRLVVVRGQQGAGRSTLLEVWCDRLADRGVVGVVSRFSMAGDDPPLAAPLDALDQVVDRLMAEDAALVEATADSLRQGLKGDVSLACTVAPPLRRLLTDSEMDDGDAMAPARVATAATRVVSALSEAHGCLVLAFDDAEHADQTSVDALALLAGGDAGPLLVVLAVRDGDASPVLLNAVDRLGAQGVAVDVVQLTGLRSDEVRHLVAEGAGVSDHRLDAVADALHARTGGVPGAVVADLERFVRAGSIRFDAQALQWRWDSDVIRAGVESNLAELAAHRVGVLPADIRATVGAVAVAGRLATTDVLSLALDQAIEVTAGHLRHATELALLGRPGHRIKWFSFSDDSIRRAALEAVGAQRSGVLRRRIAEAALVLAPRDDRGRPHPAAEHLFEILALLSGTDGELDRPAAEERLELCLRAADTARRAGAFVTALELHQRAIVLVERAGWDSNDDKCFDLYVRTARDALAVGRNELADRLLDRAWEFDPSAVQKVRAMAVLGTRWWSRGDHEVGLSEVRAMLDELGHGLPARVRLRHVAMELARTRIVLGRRPPESFIDGERMTDERSRAALDAMVGAVHLAYVREPLTHAVMVLRGLRMTVRKGVAPSSAYFIAGYGLLLCSSGGKGIERGLRFGRVGVELAERLGGSMRTLAGFAYHGFVSHWGSPIDDTVEPLLDEYRRSSAEGRGGFAQSGATFAVLHSLFAYRPLAQVAALADDLVATFDRLGEVAFGQRSGLVRQAVADLAAGSDSLRGAWFDVGAWEPDPGRPRQGEFAAVVHTVRSFVALVQGDSATAADAVGRAAAQIRTAPGESAVGVHYFHAALVAADAVAAADTTSRRKARRAVARGLERLRSVTIHPEEGVGGARIALIDALAAQASGDDGRAALHFDKAHQLAVAAGAFAEVALSGERAARLHQRLGSSGLAGYYLGSAHRALVAWGAGAAADALGSRWPDDIDSSAPAESGAAPPVRGATRTGEDALADAGRLLAQPVEVHTFLDRMLEIIVRHANASRGFLLMTNDGVLRVEAAAEQRDGSVHPVVLQGAQPYSSKVCWPAVRYAARTQETLALTDPASDRRLRADADLRHRAPRALLSLPLGIGAAGGGVLVLESDHFSRAFEESRIEAIRMLATQAVTAIAAARLSSDLGVLGRDVAGLRELAADLTVKAESDTLTGLSNRRGLESRLSEMVDAAGRPGHATSLAVVYLDLDGFKSINDNAGHAAGDVVLATAAARLRSVIRDHDLVARVGGDEFVVIATGITESELRSLSERILERLNTPVRLPSSQLATVGASIGVHYVNLDDGFAIDVVESSIAAADAAMLQAKRAGKNRVFG